MVIPMTELLTCILCLPAAGYMYFNFMIVEYMHKISEGLRDNDARLFAYFDQVEGSPDPVWRNLLREQACTCIVFKSGMKGRRAPITKLRLTKTAGDDGESLIGMASYLACVNVFYAFLKYPRLALKHRQLAQLVLRRLWKVDNTSADSVTDLARMIDAFNVDLAYTVVPA